MTIRFEDTIIPIAIRPDLVVRLQGLPFDLTAVEAAKIEAVIMAYAHTPRSK